MAGASVELSIVVPTYQRAALARRCVQALLDQNLDASLYEIVVVVDGSTDGTAEVLRGLDGTGRLRIEVTANGGQTAACNRGIELAHGRYVLFIDDDLLPGPDLAAEHLKAQHDAGGVVAVGAVTTVAGANGDGMTRWSAGVLNSHFGRLDGGGRSPDGVDVYSGNLSVPREALQRVGRFDTALATSFDIDLGCRLVEAGMRVVYMSTASAEQTSTKVRRQLVADAQARGRDALELAARYPRSLDRLPVSSFVSRRPKELLGLRLLLASRARPEAASRLLGLAARFAGRRDHAVWHLAESHAFWTGVRETCPDRETWDRMTRPPVVLMYHSVGARGEPAMMYRVPVRRLRWQLRYLRARRIAVIGLSEVMDALDSYRLPPGRSVVLTFDDGYRDNFEHALPLLRRHLHPATVFVCTAMMGGTANWPDAGELAGRALLSWDEARTLKASGVSVESHTRRHARLTELSDGEAEEELTGSRQDLERELGGAELTFAYPFGSQDGRVRALVAAAGYRGACGVRPGTAHRLSDPYLLPRVTVAGMEGLLRFAVGVELGLIPTRLRSRRRPGRRAA